VIWLGEIVRQYGPAYRVQYGDQLVPSQQAALHAIEQCRTEALGGHVYGCPACGTTRYSYHSCRNRHCPTCQHDAAQTWLARQQELLLPVPYLLLTFTLPAELRASAYHHQRIMDNLLFRASAAALIELARDPRFVGAQLGLIGVLQTWTRDLRYHPHVHYLVPGGGLADDRHTWVTAKADFLVHVKPLAALFRAKLRAALRQTALWNEIPAAAWQQPWVVDCRSVGTAWAALKYLAPDIFRVALSNNRIVRVADDQVTFRYTLSESGRTAYWHLTCPGVPGSFPAAHLAQGLCQGALLRSVSGIVYCLNRQYKFFALSRCATTVCFGWVIVAAWCGCAASCGC
jgi:hypothetical protein